MIHAGDCIEAMATMEAGSVSAIVTDPPYGIGFMGHEWDQQGEWGAMRSDSGSAATAFNGERHPAMEAGRYDRTGEASRRFQSWCQAWGTEALRIAKPGTHLLSFGSTRTYHRLAAGLEDAGWEIRDTLVWGYASGYPKSRDIGKDLGEEWAGWGTTLKPAWEPIVLARAPLRGTVAGNVNAHGTGALNIGATRMPLSDEDRAAWQAAGGYFTPGTPIGHSEHTDFRAGSEVNLGADPDLGRWPANVILTDPIFDGGIEGVEGGGEAETHSAVLRRAGIGFKGGGDGGDVRPRYVDSGTYSRFFLIPKAGRGDREPILGGLEPERADVALAPGNSIKRCVNCGSARLGAGGVHICRPGCPGKDLVHETAAMATRQNTHPTVKPLELMKRLVRLITPPGGLVLDPFLGSGTTALAAEQEGFPWVGIERDPAYVAIANARLNGTQKGLGLG